MEYKYTEDKMIADIYSNKYNKKKFVTVTDEWYGNYDGNKISVHLQASPCYKSGYGVSFVASGNDDTYVILYRDNLAPDYAISLFKVWDEYIYERIPEGCNMEWFFERGFFYD